MAFSWKNKKDIWKGEGIYFVTFAVTGRKKLLGNLVRILEDGRYAPVRPTDQLDARLLQGHWDFEKFGKHTATVRKSPLGFAISNDLQNIQKRHPGYEVCGKMVMENHLHIIIWVHDDGGKSIKQWAHGFRMGITRMARDMGLWPLSPVGSKPVTLVDGREGVDVHDMHSTTDERGGMHSTTDERGGMHSTTDERGDMHSTTDERGGMQSATDERGCMHSATDERESERGEEGGLLLEKAFIRTLSHSGQLQNMLRYTHNNPDNLLLMKDNPEMYVIRRNVEYGGLHFDAMGKARLVDYPDRNVVALSRSLTAEQIEVEVQKALRQAESGAVTYCAAMNNGEKSVTKAIRQAGYPLVVMMLGGFPPEGSETARFFHPGGAYHKACGEGHLYLMAPLADNYNNAKLIELTEQELKRKAEDKGRRYIAIPHTSERWRMIAGNVMMRMIAEKME